MKVYSVEFKTGKIFCNGDKSPFDGKVDDDGILSLYSEYLDRIFYVRVKDILIVEVEPTEGRLKKIINEPKAEFDINKSVDDFICQTS